LVHPAGGKTRRPGGWKDRVTGRLPRDVGGGRETGQNQKLMVKKTLRAGTGAQSNPNSTKTFRKKRTYEKQTQKGPFDSVKKRQSEKDYNRKGRTHKQQQL